MVTSSWPPTVAIEAYCLMCIGLTLTLTLSRGSSGDQFLAANGINRGLLFSV